MTQDPQHLDLDAISARVGKATPGPWEAQNYDDAEMDGNWLCCDRVGRPDSAKALAHVALGSEDAEFIAHAREDVPALISRIRELQAALEPFAESWEVRPERQFQLPESYGEACRVLRGHS